MLDLLLIAVLGGGLSLLATLNPVVWGVSTGLVVLFLSIWLRYDRGRSGSGVLGLLFIYLPWAAGWLLGGAASLIF